MESEINLEGVGGAIADDPWSGNNIMWMNLIEVTVTPSLSQYGKTQTYQT